MSPLRVPITSRLMEQTHAVSFAIFLSLYWQLCCIHSKMDIDV